MLAEGPGRALFAPGPFPCVSDYPGAPFVRPLSNRQAWLWLRSYSREGDRIGS